MKPKFMTQTKTVFFYLLFSLLAGSFSEAGLTDRVFETTLPNGLKVILLENHKALLRV